MEGYNEEAWTRYKVIVVDWRFMALNIEVISAYKAIVFDFTETNSYAAALNDYCVTWGPYIDTCYTRKKIQNINIQNIH